MKTDDHKKITFVKNLIYVENWCTWRRPFRKDTY